MSSRKKSILIYLGGIITGIILTFAFFFFVALGNPISARRPIRTAAASPTTSLPGGTREEVVRKDSTRKSTAMQT